eukprot:1034654-Rhodomonas_salina.1
MTGEDGVQPPSLCCCSDGNNTRTPPFSFVSRAASHTPPGHTCRRHHARSSCPNGTHLITEPSQLDFRLPTVTAARSSVAPACRPLYSSRATALSNRCR